MFHKNTKHFETDWPFSRQKVENGTVKLNYIRTFEHLVDIQTKALSRDKFENCRSMLNLKTLEEITPLLNLSTYC
jgi:hypothetical protein